jgi:hypothetical protein
MSVLVVLDVVIGIWLLAVTIAVLLLYHHAGQMLLHSSAVRAAQGPPLGETVSLRTLTANRAGKDWSLVVYAAADCSVCQKVPASLRGFAEGHRNAVAASVAYRGSIEEAEALAVRLGALVHVHHDPEGRLFRADEVSAIPFAVLADASGRVQAKGMVDVSSKDTRDYSWFQRLLKRAEERRDQIVQPERRAGALTI